MRALRTGLARRAAPAPRADFFLGPKVSLGKLCAALASLLVASLAAAGEPESDSRKHHHPHGGAGEPLATPDYWSGAHLTGDWNGARAWAAERGLEFEIVYTGEVMDNARGGVNTRGAAEYIGTPDVIADLYPERMGGWQGGQFHFWFTNVHGAGLTERHAGDAQVLSNLETEPFTTLYEAWYRHAWWDDRFWIKVGKFDANIDFAASDYGGEFIVSSFGFPPMIPFGTYPNTGLGAEAGFRINAWAGVQALFQDGAPNDTSVGGGKTMFDGEGGHVSMFEFHFSPPWLPERLPGTLKLGAWHHNGDFEELTFAQDPPPAFSSNYGAYALYDQRLLKERDDPGDEQGLGLFLQAAVAPQDRNEIDRYFGAGLVYRGALPSRDADVVGFGVAHARFSNRLNRTRAVFETQYEFFYRVQVTPFLWLQPQAVYVHQPSGVERDALALGLRFEVNF
ncbi:MAG: carbohydrate porin [Planctomycetota bacterium]|nr:carbohydrate porin [Planctomycetota bacterium]